MSGHLVRIGSRASPLARVQAEWVAARVTPCTALVWIQSQGDQDRETPLHAFGGVGVFTKALDEALCADRIDVAVHSLKDLPTQLPAGLRLVCVPEREDVRDVLVTAEGVSLEALPEGARVGTGSPRRKAQLLSARPDLRVVPLRGNVGTRLAAIASGQVEATVLAAAGLRRLDALDGRCVPLSLDVGLPAAGQGALGLVAREQDAAAHEAVAGLRDLEASAATAAERSALRHLGAGCHAPVGAHARLEAGQVHLRVRVLAPDGSDHRETRQTGALADADAVGVAAAEALRAEGAGRWIDA